LHGVFSGVVFQIRRVRLTDGSEMLLMWLSRDPEDMCDASRSHGNLTLASSINSTLDQSHHSLGEVGAGTFQTGYFTTNFFTTVNPVVIKTTLRQFNNK
jgi:hypothetical protein